MNEDRAVVIINPKSAGGKTAKTWARISRGFENNQILQTTALGHAIELTAAALKSGAPSIIAVGGDGTINEVVNGFFEDGRLISPEALLGIIPAGTSSDLRRSLNLPLDQSEAAFIVRNGNPRAVDVMRVRYTTAAGSTETRYALNVISFGMGGLVAARAGRSSKRAGGKVVFMFATAMTALRYSGRHVRITLDENQVLDERITNVAVGNGQFHGSGMQVCPNAELDDGLLDVTVIRYVGFFELGASLRKLYNGRILDHPKVQSYRVRQIRAESEETTFIEIDGEPLGRLPLEIEVIPKAIRILG